MRRLGSLTFVGLATALGCAKSAAPVTAPAAKEAPARTDRDRLQGMWAVESIDNGEAVTRDGFKYDRYTFAGDSLTVLLWGEPNKFIFGLDEGQSPKVMTLTAVPGAAKGGPKSAECLYKFEGDALVLALGTGDDPPRPTEFKARAGGKIIFTFTAGQPPPPPEPREPPAPGVLIVTLKRTDVPAPPPPPWQIIETKPATPKK